MKKLLVPALCLLLLTAGCARDPRLDCLELNARLRAKDRAFAFPEDDLFYADGVYYAFYSLHEERDMLLSMQTDDAGLVSRVALTVTSQRPESAESFFPLAMAVAGVFIPDCDTAALRETLAPGSAPLFSLTLRRYTQGRYSAALFATETGACFVAERAAGSLKD